MPKLTQTVAAAPKTLEDLNPETRAHLDALITTYNDLSFDIDALEHQRDIEKLAIGSILEEAGIDKAEAEGLIMYWTRGSKTSRLDPMKLVEQGVTTAQIENATVETPKKDFFTCRKKK